MISLVPWMVEFLKRYDDAIPGEGGAVLNNEMMETNTRVDSRVYKLYGLTEEEVEIIG
jgi:hypothetical protein